MFIREIELLEEEEEPVTIRIDQKNEGDTGVVVWDAAIVLAKYLETIREEVLDKKIIELGCGTGAVGICASALGSSVLLTDLPDLVEFINHNIQLNEKQIGYDVSAQALTWGDEEHIQEAMLGGGFDFILVSDVVFYKESVPDLVDTFYRLCNGNTEILLSYEERYSEIKIAVLNMFFKLMGERFSWTKVDQAKHHPHYRSEDIQIFRFRLKKIIEL